MENSSVVVIPQNNSFPGLGWLDKNTTFISNSSLESPPSSPAPTGPSPTAGPIIELSPSLNNEPVAPVVSSHPISNDTLNIPSGTLLNSPPVVMTKPPPSHLSTTPPPVPVVHPVPVTTKPPVGFHTTVKPKPKEWGFGDKYLASQNKRARHRNVIFDGIAGDSQSYSNYQVLSQQDVFFPRQGRKRRSVPAT
ncbi:hypothetical protein OS493_020991 [Desmophyllum pertusum]|uniref:Uncharacterized protein n=1 Tax=Desmophyllum pertusum TaxID=174260 RepID=A0A9X0D901_9CNID|nr:hypothetical protein OS493_020991 [Desmophyllum pertusum]